MTLWFDTHAHLSDPKFDQDRKAALERAFQEGVTSIVEIADGPDEWDKARQLAEQYKGRLWWAAGLHPYYADRWTENLRKKLSDLTHHNQFVGLGEVGLDYAKSSIPPEIQKKTFVSAVELALELNKPLVIHCRKAFSDLLPILRRFFAKPSSTPTPSPGVVHCFSGDEKEATELIDMGFFLGVDGPLTYPSSKILQTVLAKIPLDRIVLETDSPYLPPQTHRGQRNEPSHLPKIGLALAALRSLSSPAVGEIVTKNSQCLFRMNCPEKSS